jgi:hypothetical protein
MSRFYRTVLWADSGFIRLSHIPNRLQKELIVYEFVGKNEVLDLIAEGRKHFD